MLDIRLIIIILLSLFLLNFIFCRKRYVLSENMSNTEFHKNDDYNV